MCVCVLRGVGGGVGGRGEVLVILCQNLFPQKKCYKYETNKLLESTKGL